MQRSIDVDLNIQKIVCFYGDAPMA